MAEKVKIADSCVECSLTPMDGFCFECENSKKGDVVVEDSYDWDDSNEANRA